MELKTAVMAPKMLEMKLPIESMREGMIAVAIGFFVLLFLGLCLGIVNTYSPCASQIVGREGGKHSLSRKLRIFVQEFF